MSMARAVPAETPLLPAPFRVKRKQRETLDTWTIELDPVAGDHAEIAPGQFTMVYAYGVGEVPVSVSAYPLVHTIRAVGPVTRAICASRPGDVLGVRGPFGSSWPLGDASGSDVVIVAGGIGLAPLRPAFLYVLEHRREFGSAVLLYGGRTPADLLYRRELERWRGRLDVDVDVIVDVGAHDWRGKVGVVTQLIPRAHFDPSSTIALVVGPELMMRFTAFALLERGVPADRIYLSMERNMRCAVGHCGHCQLGPTFICREGPVYRYDSIGPLLGVREL
jgi:NAD(P)H-flavin reductase